MENSVETVRPNIETVKRLLLDDLNKNSNFTKNQTFESTFCEVDEEPPTKIEVSRTYSRPTPQKRALKSLENTLYSPRTTSSPLSTKKQKRKKAFDEEEDDAANRSIVEITEQFKKVEDFMLAVE